MSDALGRDEFTTAFARNGRALWVIASAWVGRDDAERFVVELEALVEGTDDEGARAQPSARSAQADLERMEAMLARESLQA